MAGDWGDVSDEDRVANELALQEGDHLFSVHTKKGLAKNMDNHKMGSVGDYGIVSR